LWPEYCVSVDRRKEEGDVDFKRLDYGLRVVKGGAAYRLEVTALDTRKDVW